MNKEQKFFKLLKYSNELEKNKKFLFKEKSFELSDFLIESKRYKIGNSLARVYGYCDSFNPDSNSCIADEEELRNCAQVLL